MASSATVVRSNDAAGRPVVIRLANGPYALQNGPFRFDELTLASQVTLEAPANMRTTLDSSAGGVLFEVSAGAPLVILRRLQLRNQVVVTGGELHVDVTLSCIAVN